MKAPRRSRLALLAVAVIVGTAGLTPALTAAATDGPTPTATDTGAPTPEPTETATSTPTPEPTATATSTPEPTATATPEPTATATPTPTATATPTPTATATATPVTVSRIAGVDRQATAAALSAATFDANVPVVFIATGGNFPDALSAAPAAAKLNGPLLLVDRDSMSQPVRDELRRLKPNRIVVVGSALSISDDLLSGLAGYAKSGEAERIGGVDRYDTAAKLVAAAFPKGSSQAWLATGEKFPDALAAAAAAGSVRAPVLLVNGGLGTADPTTKALVSGLGVDELTIAGSALSVSDGIASSLPVKPLRIGGVDRYDTSVKLNRAAFDTASTVYLATGEKFPDALSGATAAGFTKSPLYTVQPDCVPQPVLDDIERLGASKIVLLGGPTTLSEGVATLTACR